MILGFTEDHGIAVDVVQDGYLFLVRRRDDLGGLPRRSGLQRSLGVAAELLSDAATAVARASPSTTRGRYVLRRRWHRRSRQRSRRGTRRSPTPAPTCGWVSRSSGSRSTPAVVGCPHGGWLHRRARRGERGGAMGRGARGDRWHTPSDWNRVPRMVVTTGGFPGAPERRTLVIDAATSYYFHKEGDGVLTGMGGRDEHRRSALTSTIDSSRRSCCRARSRVFPPVEHAGLGERGRACTR